jgi:hypothetical protein
MKPCEWLACAAKLSALDLVEVPHNESKALWRLWRGILHVMIQRPDQVG